MKTIFSFLLIVSVNCFSTTLKLEKPDSLYYGFWGIDKMVFGNTTIIEAKGKKFKIGVFDLFGKGNDSLQKGGFIAIYYINSSKEFNFYKKFDLINCGFIKNLKYLLIEGDLYAISSVNLNQLTILKKDASDLSVLDGVNFLDCLYNINYFDNKYVDGSDEPIRSSELLKKNKLNIIYSTITHCKPCEEMKYDMVELASNKKVNVNFITEAGVNFDSAYKNISQKYFSKDQDHIKYYGYPSLILFDDEGNFIKTINRLNSSVINTIKNDADSYK